MKEIDLSKIKKELDRVNNLYDETKNDIYLHQAYCIDHFLEISIKTYSYILKYCLQNNIKGIVDIGCAMGYQSEIFLNYGINYIGVEESSSTFWNSDKFKYINLSYPCDLSDYKDYLAVSVLCLTWNCYLYEGNKTLEEQLQNLSNDFSHCLIYAQKDNIQNSKKYFTHFNWLGSNYYELKK